MRIYKRQQHFVLQWWDPAARRTLSDRVNGDLVAAILRARQIDERLEHFRSGGQSRRRMRHGDLVEQFTADLHRRANAGEIDPRSVVRYSSALGHYLRFAEQAQIETKFPSATGVNRDFAMGLAAYLAGLRISPNGHPNSSKRRMIAPRYVEDVVRTMFAWAADPERGNLMPEGFRNPFVGKGRRTTETARDLYGEPDVTVDMAAEFLEACDPFQLPLFAVLALYGLRPSELCFLLRENLCEGWLKIPCLPGLGYQSKGRRDKRVPLVEPLTTLLEPGAATPREGLLFLRREVLSGAQKPPLLGAGLNGLEQEFERRCGRVPDLSARARVQLRDAVLKEAGAITYDHVEHEFRRITRHLDWPAAATLKDFRHLFSTAIENAGMPLFSRRYLLGHSPGTTALVNYTHVNALRQHYEAAANSTLGPVIAAVVRRARELRRC